MVGDWLEHPCKYSVCTDAVGGHVEASFSDVDRRGGGFGGGGVGGGGDLTVQNGGGGANTAGHTKAPPVPTGELVALLI
jgi:hypothetical protein